MLTEFPLLRAALRPRQFPQRPMHGLVAARLGYSDLALRYFQDTVAIDLADDHTAILGGRTWRLLAARG
jgi:hypothetical protein